MGQQVHLEKLVRLAQLEQLVFRAVLELQVVWDQPDPRGLLVQPAPRVLKVAQELQALWE